MGSFVSWYLLVYLTRSKPTVNKVLVIILHPKCHTVNRNVKIGDIA